MQRKWKQWKAASQNQQLSSLEVQQDKAGTFVAMRKGTVENGTVRIVANYSIPDVNGQVQFTYTINAAGDIQFGAQVTGLSADLPNLPRFGVNMILPMEYQQVSWYGRGPHENYQDRKTSALVGRYDASVADLYFPYGRPQENGFVLMFGRFPLAMLLVRGFKSLQIRIF